MKNAWPSENKGERVRTGAVKRVVNVSVYSPYLMKFRLLSTAAPVHLSFHKGEYTHILLYINNNKNNDTNKNDDIVNVSV